MELVVILVSLFVAMSVMFYLDHKWVGTNMEVVKESVKSGLPVAVSVYACTYRGVPALCIVDSLGHKYAFYLHDLEEVRELMGKDMSIYSKADLSRLSLREKLRWYK